MLYLSALMLAVLGRDVGDVDHGHDFVDEVTTLAPITTPGTVPCLTPSQDKILKTSIMAIDSTLKITVTSLNIAAMWKNGTVKEQLQESAKIIGAVDEELVPKMVKITEETCGTCTQIVGGVKDIVHSLEDTLTKSVPDWKSNPIYNSIVMAVNAILQIVPNFCPQASELTLKADAQCLTPKQEKTLKTTMMSLSATIKIASSSLEIAAIWQQPPKDEQLRNASKILDTVDTDLIEKLTPIVESTCGTCSQITMNVNTIVQDLEKTMTDAVPDWKTNPIYMSVTTALNGLLSIVPNFCPQVLRLTAHQWHHC